MSCLMFLTRCVIRLLNSMFRQSPVWNGKPPRSRIDYFKLLSDVIVYLQTVFANPPNQKKSSLNQSTHLSCLIPNNFSPSNFHMTSAHLAIKHYNLRFTDTLKKVTTSNFNVKLHKPLLTDLFDGLSQNVLLNVQMTNFQSWSAFGLFRTSLQPPERAFHWLWKVTSQLLLLRHSNCERYGVQLLHVSLRISF